MAIKNREQVGWITCGLCGDENARVHESKPIGRGGRVPALYYRCDNCGCIQPWQAGGQAVMREKMRPMDAKPMETGGKPEPEPVEVVPEPVRKPKRSGFLNALLNED